MWSLSPAISLRRQWLHHSSMAQGWESTLSSLSSLAISNYPWHQPSAITQILLKSNCSSLLPWPPPWSKRLSFLMWTTVKFSHTGYSPSSLEPQSILYTSARTGFSNHIVDGITELLKAYSFSILLDKAQPSFTCFTVLLSAYPAGHNPYLFYNIISFHLMSQPWCLLLPGLLQGLHTSI